MPPAREERPARPPTALQPPAPLRQPPPEEEEEDANSYDSDEGSAYPEGLVPGGICGFEGKPWVLVRWLLWGAAPECHRPPANGAVTPGKEMSQLGSPVVPFLRAETAKPSPKLQPRMLWIALCSGRTSEPEGCLRGSVSAPETKPWAWRWGRTLWAFFFFEQPLHPSSKSSQLLLIGAG